MKNLDLIDRFFQNTLNPKEQKLFNSLLQHDPNFKEEFLFQKDLKQVIKINQQEALKSTLSQIEEKVDKKYGYLKVPKKWMIAASFLVITSLSIWGIQSVYYPSNEAIYAEYFHPDRNTIQPIVRGESIKTIEYRAFVAYESQDYYKAINLFNSVKSPDEIYIIYYKGLSFLALNKNDAAVILLHQVATNNVFEDNSSDFQERANWYLSLAYINNNQNEDAIMLLNQITDNPEATFKKQEAKEILNYLE